MDNAYVIKSLQMFVFGGFFRYMGGLGIGMEWFGWMLLVSEEGVQTSLTAVAAYGVGIGQRFTVFLDAQIRAFKAFMGKEKKKSVSFLHCYFALLSCSFGFSNWVDIDEGTLKIRYPQIFISIVSILKKT